MINVTKTYLPPIEEYQSYIKKIWENGWITNNGPLVIELEQKLKEYLSVSQLIYCGNGTIALQIAIKALELKNEIITTPFSYVATANSILWENCKPLFVDINPQTFCIDADKIEAAITKDTEAILAVHVYGVPCEVEKIEAISNKHNLKVIYDGAHAFGVKVNGRSIFSYGNISTCSFHATKLFHTIEGGAVIATDHLLNEKVNLLRQFGHIYDEYRSIGINGKNSEFHAAMGLCNIIRIDELIEKRKIVCELYDSLLSALPLQKLSIANNVQYNYAYYPVVFENEKNLIAAMEMLKNENIIPRRYFYPSLNTLSHIQYAACP
ncbi:MAG: DegT/DnrJ/EryC1/StrS family aminotransferase, partial [Chitinophagales bacterium]|nr:DegT/DnrJ/EryC1/StrS family aminotransferase [Chitinophagales bacterium]